MNALCTDQPTAATNMLWRPWAFQAEDMAGASDHSAGQSVDLETIDPQHRQLIISAYLPQAKPLDQVVVHFEGLADRTYTVVLEQRYVHDIAAYSFDELPSPGLCNLSYSLYRARVKVADSPALALTLADSRYLGWRAHRCSAYGLYPQGLVDAWIASGPQRLTDGSLVIRSIDGSVPQHDVTLDLLQRPWRSDVAIKIGHIAFDARLARWQATLTETSITATRGDLFQIVQPDTQLQWLNFALAL